MNLNFFRQDCQYPPISDRLFGLCDKQDGTKAYPDTINQETWIARVKNENCFRIVFTAIDKCVLGDDEYEGRGRCDGMLTAETHLYLVELKHQRTAWLEDAIDQLDSTIQLLMENHDISQYKKRKAFASNRKRRRFVVIDNEFNKAFYKRTTFRIDTQAEILII